MGGRVGGLVHHYGASKISLEKLFVRLYIRSVFSRYSVSEDLMDLVHQL